MIQPSDSSKATDLPSPASSEILDGLLDPEMPQNLMGMVEESARYLRSIDELLIPSGMKRNEILKAKEIHVGRLENVVDSLLQNFLVS